MKGIYIESGVIGFSFRWLVLSRLAFLLRLSLVLLRFILLLFVLLWLLRQFFLVVSVQDFEDRISVLLGIEKELANNLAIIDDLPCKLVLSVVDNKFFLLHLYASNKLVLIHDINVYLVQGFRAVKGHMFVFPDRFR